MKGWSCHFWADFRVGVASCCACVEIELRTVKQYRYLYCCICKNYGGKVMEDGQKCLCKKNWLTRRLWMWVSGEEMHFFCIQQHKHKFLLVARHSLIMSFKNAIKVGIVNFTIHCCCLPLWRKYAPERKTNKGTWAMRGKSQGMS